MPKFTKKVRQNSTAPKNSPPLTVIEFSLTDEVRNRLQLLLKPFVSGERTDEEELGGIFMQEENFPQEIIQELRALDHVGGAPSTVFVIHNLPETSKEEFYSAEPGERLSYAGAIGTGLGIAIGLERTWGVKTVERTYKQDRENKGVIGNVLHKHREDVSGIMGLYNATRAKTLFTDLETLIDEAAYDPHYASIAASPFSDFGLLSTMKARGTWQNPGALSITNPAINPLIDGHSQEVEFQNGTLALWTNHGRIAHIALPGMINDDVYKPDDIVRVVHSLSFDFQKAER